MPFQTKIEAVIEYGQEAKLVLVIKGIPATGLLIEAVTIGLGKDVLSVKDVYKVEAYFVGYFFVGGYQLYRSMALAFSRSLVKVGDTGLAYGLVETGNALAVVVAPLAAGFLYNYRPEAVYIASLGALAITVGLNMLLFHEKRNEILPAQT